MEAIVAQIQSLAASMEEPARQKLISTLYDVALSLESTHDTAQRILFSQVQLSAIRFACDLDLFRTLCDSSSPLGLEELSERTGSAPLLLGRVLRYLASIRAIKEVDKDTYTKSKVSEIFAIRGFEGGVYHIHDFAGPSFTHFPEYAKAHGYRDITDGRTAPLPSAFNSDLPMFELYGRFPVTQRHFNAYMGVQNADQPRWTDVYPYRESAAAVRRDPGRVFFVDVGGGLGHQAVALRERLPVAEVPNAFVVQDRAAVVGDAVARPGVEFVEQDFFRPQEIRGAKIYYLRYVLHDWADDRCVAILSNLRAGLAPDSKILIDEMVMPDTDAHFHATGLDMLIMTCCAAVERTEEQWRAVVAGAGLKIDGIYPYTVTMRNSVIECSLA